jgi:pimeloyl-ACP methyl ester carboxylesterase
MGIPRVLLLPGALGAASFWQPVGGRLPARWEKVYVSWPGLGLEPPSASVGGFAECARLAEQHLDRPCDIVAHSMGGIVAVLVALANPQHVRRLVLTATSGGVDVASLGGAEWRDSYRAENPAAARWITDARPDLSEAFERISSPTLLLWGDSDPISPVAVGEHLRSLLPNAVLRVVSGGNHAFPHDDPDTVSKLIIEHLHASEPASGTR